MKRTFGPYFLNKNARFYKNKSYLDGYAAHTDGRVADDPARAIGGMWNEIGELQFQFLKRMGLKPEHRMLDIGCGTLRGGRFFIRYLGVSNYTGVDISTACIDAAKANPQRKQGDDRRFELLFHVLPK